MHKLRALQAVIHLYFYLVNYWLHRTILQFNLGPIESYQYCYFILTLSGPCFFGNVRPGGGGEYSTSVLRVLGLKGRQNLTFLEKCQN